MTALRLSALSGLLLDTGFGLGAVWTLARFIRDSVLPMTPWGFRSMSGPAEELGRTGFVVLGAGLVIACVVDALASAGIWRRQRRAGVLAAATGVAQLALGLAFALPFLLLGVPIRLMLLAAGWQHLR